MPEGRPSIPAALDRSVREEAGHRCAITTCRSTAALELAHIVSWAEVKEHAFENLILLCANDHYRYDRGDISRISMRNYKANLSVLNSRYSDTEKRILEWFVEHGMSKPLLMEGSGLLDITTQNLVRDGLVKVTETKGARAVTALKTTDGRQIGMVPGRLPCIYEMTDAGMEFARNWLQAGSLE